MNCVSLIGTLTDDPELSTNRTGEDVCRMRIAVPRRDRSGRQLPGVVYVDVTTFGAEARGCAARLRRSGRVGLSGRLERDEYRTVEGEWLVEHAVLVDQLDPLADPPADYAS